MRVALTTALLAGIAATAATPATAQSVPNLSGTWVLQPEQSDFAGIPAPQSRIDVIDHQEPKLTIKRTVVTPAGETSSNLVYGVDGKPYKNTAGPSELTSTLRWDGQTLVMVSTVAMAQGEVTITDRYTLAADGKTLTQERTLSGSGQQIAQKMILVKQP